MGGVGFVLVGLGLFGLPLLLRGEDYDDDDDVY
jgi:hypothetical protein